MAEAKAKFILRIYRGIPGHQYWEEFELYHKPGLNVISALMEIQKRPINRKGKSVTPVVWEMSCLEEVCGSCSMLVNGVPRQACTALIQGDTTLAPFSKFPLIRDLIVDRTKMFTTLKTIQGWIPIEELHSPEAGPKITPAKQEAMYVESTCMTCGCCLEACPQYGDRNEFIGASAINQVKLFNAHPTGATLKSERLNVLMDKGGLSSCGNAQNCKEVCPKKIPLTQSIAKMGRDTTAEATRRLRKLPEDGE